MNSLKELQEGFFRLEKSENIFYQMFENFFQTLHNGKNIINFSCKREDTKSEFEDLLRKIKLEKGKKLILSVNGDTDIPCVRKEYLLQDNIPYSEEKQRYLEGLPLSYFLESDAFENIPEDTNMYCHSVIKGNPQIHMIPIGRDPKGKFILDQFEFKSNEKSTLCYYNCSIPPMSIHWYGRIRSYIYDGLLNLNFVKIEHVDLNQHRILDANAFINYYTNIAKSKFMICPRGCGLDTYRLWDCLYLGCIPIVVKYDGYQDFSDLPILFIEKWEDYLSLTQEYLETKYEEMLNLKYNYEKLNFRWWKEKILSNCP